MTNWVGRTAAEIAAAVREKRATPSEVVAEHLDRIERLDGRVGAFRTVRTGAALAEAEEVGARGDLAELPLAGVPVAVKDNLAVRGSPPGSAPPRRRTPPRTRITSRWPGCGRRARWWWV